MKIIISPAKSLDFDSELNTKNFSNPKFLEKTLNIDNLFRLVNNIGSFFVVSYYFHIKFFTILKL